MTAVAAPGTRREVELREPPGLGALYARAGLASGRAAVGGPLRRALGGAPSAPRSPVLPAVLHRLDDVRPDPGALTAYQHLVGEPAGDVLPAGYVHVLAFPVATALIVRADFPLPALGMVHLANRVEQREPLRVTDLLDVRAWAQDLRPHRKGAQVDLVTEVRRAGSAPGDVPAWRGVSTYLAPGVRLPGAAPEEAARAEFVPPAPTGRWALDAGTGRRYAAVSGDANPIHLTPLTARALGFPRAIAHGMYTAARALADVGARRGEAYTWDVEFAAPVLLPSSPAVRVGRGEDGSGWTVVAWDGKRGKLHLSAAVRPLV
ncbi:MaoC family dehydratase [Cellulomonas sp. Marseille-Q8402]